ncbi:MAG: molybdopterin-binding protein [Roseiarcus sp.]
MKFGSIALDEAEGAIAAHAIRGEGVALRKGQKISAADIAHLRSAGVSRVVAARLEPGDIAEDIAAERLAELIAGEGVRREKPFTGRVNLFAAQAGLAAIDAAAIDAINALDEAVTVATLPLYRAVAPGDMIATVKIIPFAARAPHIEAAERTANARASVGVAPFRPLRVAMVSTLLPGLKTSVVVKTVEALEDRLAPCGCKLVFEVRVPHDVAPLADAIKLAARRGDLVVVFGASAITDRRDVIPSAIEACGGRIKHFGMPVDPGNLLLIGELAGKPVIGAPGCARSPRENGFDWVLQRIIAGIPIGRAEIQAMGVGGLLMEIFTRPQLRAGDE